MTKLNQVIAIEKGIKARANSELTEIYKKVQKPDLFNGLVKNYQPKEENGETLPSESQKVQEFVSDILRQAARSKSELFDVTAQKDYANMSATADVKIGNQTIIANAPVPFLLFLEKELTDLRTLIGKLPVLDTADDWAKDEAAGLYKTSVVRRNRTAKVQKPLVLYPATTEHPAQTQIITEDVTVGVWEQVKHSGAIPKPERDALLERAESLLNAVKYAREEANQADAPPVKVGDAIFGYLFS